MAKYGRKNSTNELALAEVTKFNLKIMKPLFPRWFPFPSLLKGGLFIFFTFQLMANTFATQKYPECEDLLNEEGDMMLLLEKALKGCQFSKARVVAWQLLSRAPRCAAFLRQRYTQEADKVLANLDDLTTLTECATQQNKSESISSTSPPQRLQAKIDDPDCWAWDLDQDTLLPPDLWSTCCSLLPQNSQSTQKQSKALLFGGDNNDNTNICTDAKHRSLCCDLFRGSSSYLHLPLLQELALRLRVETDQGNTLMYELEQDGFLRQFDTAGILWPTAYLLSLCLASPRKCGIETLVRTAIAGVSSKESTLAMELGTGIGAPAIVLADFLKEVSTTLLHGPAVMATDISRAALALTASNAAYTNVQLSLHELDFMNLTAVRQFSRDNGGFAIVLGSSLMALYGPENTQILWQVLDLLLDENNPHAIAILSHSIHSIPSQAGAGLNRVTYIPGNHPSLGMRTRQGSGDFDNASYDFAISVFGRQSSADRTFEEL